VTLLDARPEIEEALDEEISPALTAEETGDDPTLASPEGEQWNRRPVVGRLVRLVAMLGPVVASLMLAMTAASVVPRPDGFLGTAGWWLGLSSLAIVVGILVGRITRRLLPLAALLELSGSFPDEAPSRVATALRSVTVSELDDRLVQAEREGRTGSDEARAAEHVLTLVSSMNNRDRRLRAHSERVRALTDVLAEEMGLDPQESDKLRWAALVHDVGKLRIDRDVLRAGATRTRQQDAEYWRYPREGSRLITPLRGWLGPWAAVVDQHRERMDGSGNPKGIAGDEISLGARIVAVADVFDEITSGEYDGVSRSASDAREIIALDAGEQFDPDVVRALMDVSLGRLRRITGPAAIAAQVPLVGSLAPGSGGLGSLVGTAGAAAAAVPAVAALTVGAMSGGAQAPDPLPSVEMVTAGDAGQWEPGDPTLLPGPAFANAAAPSAVQQGKVNPPGPARPRSVVTDPRPPAATGGQGPATTSTPTDTSTSTPTDTTSNGGGGSDTGGTGGGGGGNAGGGGGQGPVSPTPGQGATPPGLGGVPPGLGTPPPGLGGVIPGQGNPH